jgi:hypothetical protein
MTGHRGICWRDASYLSGVDSLLEASGRNRAHLYTLNYDVAVESALHNGKVSWTTGFTSGEKGEIGFFDPSSFDDSGTRIAIFKLHGSHRWAVAKGATKVGFGQSLVVELPLPRYFRIARNAARLRRPQHFRVTLHSGNLAASRVLRLDPARLGGAASFGGTDFETTPLLIFADENKARWSQPYRTLHNRFDSSLHASGVLIVIGYGWGDAYLNERIGEAFSLDRGLAAIVSVSTGEPPYRRLLAQDCYLASDWLVDTILPALHGPKVVFWVRSSAREALTGKRCQVFTLRRRVSDSESFRFEKLREKTLSEVVRNVTTSVEVFLDAASAAANGHRVRREGRVKLS